MFKELATGIRHFSKGETILSQGADVKYLYLLLSGSCYRYLMTEKGDSVIYEIKEAGDTLHSLVGALAIYNKNETSQFTYVARTSCICRCIPADDFRCWAAQRPDIQNQLLRLTLHYYEELKITYQAHQEGRAANQICRLLLKCAGQQEQNWIIEKKYSFSEMASMAGVHAVTVSRIVRHLCEQGIMEKQGDKLRVHNMDQLMRYANNEDTLNYK